MSTYGKIFGTIKTLLQNESTLKHRSGNEDNGNFSVPE